MNNAPHQFNHMDLIREFENLKKDYKEAAEHKQWRIQDSLETPPPLSRN